MLAFLCLLLSASLCLATPYKSRSKVTRAQDAYLQRMQGRFDPMHNECEISKDERQQCGRKTYSEQECQTRGCCWEICDSANCTDVPWCFVAKRMLREECSVAYEQKDDCGYYGITEGECFMRDCCWRPSPLPNDPPCFQKGSLRLVNGPTEASGRVEIRHEGEWGTICDDGFGQQESDVVCRALGYSFSTPRGYATFGQGSGPIWMDDLQCTGDESRLEDCRHNGWGSHNCGHSEDAGVDCFNAEPTTTPYPTYETYDTYDYNYDYDYDDDYTYRAGAGRNGFPGKPQKRSFHKKKAAAHKKSRDLKDLIKKVRKVPFKTAAKSHRP